MVALYEVNWKRYEMSRLITYQSGGFTNYGISYRKYSPEELEERAMQEEVNTRVKTKETEVDYITEIHKDMVEVSDGNAN